jgi:hypothetical protein
MLLRGKMGGCLATAAVVVVLSGCGSVTTVTEHAPTPPSTTAPAAHAPKAHKAPATVALNNPAQQPDSSATAYCNEVPEGHACHAVTTTPSDPNESPQRNCDTNIVANGATSCALAENAFYEYYESRNVPEKYRAIEVYSPATHKDYELDCDEPGRLIACTSSPLSQSIYVSFPQAAIDAYTDSQASAYANKRNVGHPGPTAGSRVEEKEAAPEPEPSEGQNGESGGEDEVGSYSHAGDAEFCSLHECIGDFEGEDGYVVECEDESFSHAGGISGACSDHGGEN